MTVPHRSLARSGPVSEDEAAELRERVENLNRRLEENRIHFKQANVLAGKYHVKERTMEFSPEMAALLGAPECGPDIPTQGAGTEMGLLSGVFGSVNLHEIAANGERSGSTSVEIKIATGEIRLYDARFTTVFDGNGEPEAVLVAFIDITDQQEQKLAYERWQTSSQPRKTYSTHYYEYNLTTNVLEMIHGSATSIYPKQNERSFTGVAAFVAQYVIHPEDRAEYLRVFDRETLIRRFHEGITEIVTKHRRRGPDGSYYRAQGIIQLQSDSFNGDVLCFVFIRNLDRAFSSIQREMNVDAFNLLSDSIPGGIVFAHNRPGLPCYFINSGMLDFVGYTREEFDQELHGEILRLIHPDERDKVAALSDEAARTGREFESTHRVLRKNGENGRMILRGRCGIEPNGDAIIIITLVDITEIVSLHESLEHALEEMRAKDQELAASNRKLEAALQISESGVWGIDLDRKLLNYDAMTGHILRLPERQSVDFDEFVQHLTHIDAGFKDSALHHAFAALDAEAMVNSFGQNRRLVFPNGDQRYTHNAIDYIDSQHIVGTIRDVTADIALANDLRAAKEAAETANRGKSLFLSKMSHEIRTPMNAIIGISDLLLAAPMTGKQREFVHDIRTASSALLGIINDILDMSKIEAGKLELRPVNFNLHELIANIRSMFGLTASKKGIRFIVREGEGIPEILHGDEIRLRQILINLLSNAVKFTQYGHVKLSVDVDASDNQFRFEVADTGTGMRKKDLDNIFHDFAQFHHEANTSAAGTGLGMAIVKALVDKMGGDIAIRSDVGVGTVITFRIPLDRPKDHTDTSVRVQVRELSCPTARILVVDDTEVNLKVASGYLGLADIVCDTAESGVEALEKIKANDYDLVFMDHMMPGMDGLETTRRIRSGNLARLTLPVIALTANAAVETRGVFLASGMNDFLGKPIDQGELVAILKKWLPTEKVKYKTQAPSADAEAAKPVHPFFERVADIPEISATTGLQWIDGRVEIYEKTLRLLERSLPATVDQLETGLAKSLPQDIFAAAHAIKSSLAVVGADRLSREAAALEDAGKRGDMNECQSRLPLFVRDLRAFGGQLAELFAARGGNATPLEGDRQALASALAEARTHLDAFDGDAALAALPTLADAAFGPDIDALLGEVRRETEGFEYERALVAIGKILEALRPT